MKLESNEQATEDRRTPNENCASTGGASALIAPGGCEYNVILGDCLEKMRELPDHSVDLVVTSPPYARRRQSIYGGIDPENYSAWFLPIAAEIMRVLEPTGTFILNIKEHVTDGGRNLYVYKLALALCERQGWILTEEWPWIKKNCHPGRWPNRFRDAMERVYQFNAQRDFAMFQDAVRIPAKDSTRTRTEHLSSADQRRQGSRTGSGFGKKVSNWVSRDTVYPDNVLNLATECANQNHPAAFPVALPDFFIRLFTRPGDTVLDPFSGSGTTGVAAARLGRRYIGIEIVHDYVVASRERIEQALH